METMSNITSLKTFLGLIFASLCLGANAQASQTLTPLTTKQATVKTAPSAHVAMATAAPKTSDKQTVKQNSTPSYNPSALTATPMSTPKAAQVTKTGTEKK
jgi:hypothetical protein